MRAEKRRFALPILSVLELLQRHCGSARILAIHPVDIPRRVLRSADLATAPLEELHVWVEKSGSKALYKSSHKGLLDPYW